jgi:tetratricopeptide (TPR) repeat protein
MRLVVEAIHQENLKNNDEAELFFQKAIRLDPKNEIAYNNLGYLYYIQKKIDYSIENYKKAIELNPRYIYSYNNLSIVCAHQKEWGRSIEIYKKVIEIDPKNSLAYGYLAWAYYKQKNYDLALKNIHESLKIDSQDLYSMDTLIQIKYALFQEEKDPVLKKQYQKDFESSLKDASTLDDYKDQKSLYYYRCVSGVPDANKEVCRAALDYLKGPSDASSPNDVSAKIAKLEKIISKQ